MWMADSSATIVQVTQDARARCPPSPGTLSAMGMESLSAISGMRNYLIEDPNRTSLHKVRGDSMKDAGILEGDIVVVEHHTPTKPGDIVVAWADNELTVKTLLLDQQGRYYLQPANSAYPPIIPRSSLEVMGVVIGLVRRTRR